MSSDKRIEEKAEATELDLNALKTGGVIKQRQRDLFTVRLQCPGGRVPLEKLQKMLEVARRYGGEYVHLSFRQSIEIPYVHFRDLDKVRSELSESGQEIASCGARVRAPTACSGCEYNPNGLTDTQRMAQEVSRLFFGKGDLSHKFKISFSGCPIDCARTNEMELGFQGAVEPKWDEAACVACGVCIEACREGALIRDDQSGRPRFIGERCLYCGDCIRTCPFDAWQVGRVGWMVRCGGKHGRHPVHGQVIAEFLPDEKITGVIAAVLHWYEENGSTRGRTRLGDLLLDERGAWRKFLRDIEPALGQCARKDAPRPRRNEIHFPKRRA